MRSFPLVLASLLFTAGCDIASSIARTNPDLTGHVRIDGKPAPGITVVANSGSRSSSVQTDANGAYVFGQLPWGSATVSVSGLPDFVIVDGPERHVDLGSHELEVSFEGFSPKAILGHVLWHYERDLSMGVPGISAHLDRSPFPVGDVASTTDGSYRFPRAPGFGQFPVVLGPLPAGLIYLESDRWTYEPQGGTTSRDGLDTAYVGYKPSASLTVEVLVDGLSYSGAEVHLATPIPVTAAGKNFINLPVMPLEVSIRGFPSSITFDSTVKMVPLTAGGLGTIVRFTGYKAGSNRPPVVTILAPATGATFTAGTPITFRGTASDPEDGALTGNAVDWFDSTVGAYGHGEVLTVSTLSVGQHHVVFRAFDSGGSQDVATIDVTIVPATGGRVAGTIRIGNERTYDARLSLSTTPARTAATDLQGQFAFEDVPPGTYTVTLQSVECAEFTPMSRSIKVDVGVTTVADFTGVSVYCYDYGIARPGSKAVRRPPRTPERVY